MTFQEYLASVHVKEEKLVQDLARRVGHTWWHETARLYAAQGDASVIVKRCLSRMTAETLLLATDCEAEALELKQDLRDALRVYTEEAVEASKSAVSVVAAEYLLARRVRSMTRIDDDHYVDTSPVTHAEYQLFIDETRVRGEYRQPDHWESYRFPRGAGKSPVVGIRKEDAEAFCQWLTRRTPGEWVYSLPTLASLGLAGDSRWKLHFFTTDGAVEPETLPRKQVIERIRKDCGVVASPATTPGVNRSVRRVLCFASSFHFPTGLDLVRALARDPDRDLSPALARDRAREPARDLARDLERTLTRERALDRARALARRSAPALAGYRALDLLIWLCVVENRIERNESPVEALWLARWRKAGEKASESAPGRSRSQSGFSQPNA